MTRARAMVLAWGSVGLLGSVATAAHSQTIVDTLRLQKAGIDAGDTVTRNLPAGTYATRAVRVSLLYDASDRRDVALPTLKTWSYTVPFTVSIGGTPQTGTFVISRSATEDVYESLMQFDVATPSATTPSPATTVQLYRSPPTATTATPDVPSSISLLLITEITPTPTFDPNLGANRPTLTVDAAGFATWTGVAGAIEYDLEWVFVDSYRIDNAADWFAVKRASRVTLTDRSYQLPSYGPAGKVYARVRAVGLHLGAGTPDAPARRVGRWATAPGIASTPLENNKNWRLESIFAEQGKRSRSIAYYDGLLRERQRIRVSSADSVGLVGETKYDHEGRSVMSILPVPRSDTALTYAVLFNRDLTNQFLGPEDYSEGQFTALSQSSGAGRYFSPNNSIQGPHWEYIPAANGYPFSQREYTRDAAGRLRASGGLGDTLRLGGYHERQFGYGSANATQLHRLFGSQVGIADHYRRNVSRDENRQFAITYVDDKDRTIATALAADAPPALVPLASNVADSTTYSLNDANQIDRDIGESRSLNRIVNAEGATYSFKYDLTGVNYTIPIPTTPATTFCATCSYELTIAIIGPNGDSIRLVDDVTGDTTARITRSVGPTPNACAATGPSTSLAFHAVFSDIGEYSVSKLVKLLAGSVDVLVTNYETTRGVIARQTFIDDEMTQVDSTECANTCQQHCAADPAAAGHVAECVAACEGLIGASLGDMEQAQCDNIKNGMIAEVSPGGRLFEDPVWLSSKFAQAGLKNAAGTSFPYPGSPAALRAMWRPEWAQLLEEVDDEDCHEDVCANSELLQSKIHDDSSALVHTYADALSGGWLNPMAMTATPRGPPSGPVRLDPYFWGFSTTYRVAMRDTLARFETAPDGSIVHTLWEYVADSERVYGPGATTPVPPDEQWRVFRGIYLGLKQHFHAKVMELGQSPYLPGVCPYVDDSLAHFKKPLDFSTETEVTAAQDAALADYCGNGASGLCQVRAQAWREELLDSCPTLTTAVLDQVKTLLAQYCGENCGITNPLGLITPEAIAQGNPILTQVQTLLGACSLTTIAEEDPVNYEESCRVDCTSTLGTSACTLALVDLLNTRLPSRTGAVVISPADRQKLGACAVPGYKPTQSIRVTDSLLPWALIERDSTSCAIAFLLASGQAVSMSSIRHVLSSNYAATYPATITQPGAQARFAHIELLVQLTRAADTVRLYVFSNCALPLVESTEECTKAVDPGRCTEDLFATLKKELSRALDRSPLSVADVSQCFDTLSVAPAIASLIPSKTGRNPKICSPCQLSLFTADGVRISFTAIASWGDPVTAAHYPGPFQRDPIYGIPFAGFTVTVKVRAAGQIRDVKAYVFSSCPLDMQPACEPFPTGIDMPKVDTIPADSLCLAELGEEAASYGNDMYVRTKTELEVNFERVQANKCFDAPFSENFRYSAKTREYHYALYYYDQSDNLVQTIPPADVQLWTSGADPVRLLPTRYRYNALNQLLVHRTPDGGETRFWYNHAAQLRLSQNADQGDTSYSFAKYDVQNRLIETGVVAKLTPAQRDAGLALADFPDAANFTLSEITHVVYDTAAVAICQGFAGEGNLRGRISASVVASRPGVVTSATCYSYDPHGNVSSILQSIDGLGAKRIDYDYDLVSGNINGIFYQRGQVDQMLYRYRYDRDNRLVAAYSSTDSVIWIRDASYQYYKHRPVARIELGDPVVQGLDYVYTVQGWSKGLNANTLDPTHDPGRDGDTMLAANPGSYIPTDEFAFTLQHYAGDYTATGAGATQFEAQTQGSSVAAAGPSLFNGNIAHQVSATGAFMVGGASPLAVAYRHDQINRLDTAVAFLNLNTTSNAWGSSSATGDYLAAINYDANGNIRTFVRNAKETPGVNPPGFRRMDSLTYRYDTLPSGRLRSDRLLHIDDGIPAATHAGDLDDQGAFQLSNASTHNYGYNGRGELVSDRSEGIKSIGWNADGLAGTVTKTAGRGPDIEFRYDATGRRVLKIVKPQGAASAGWQYLYYVRDHSGQVLATYIERQVGLSDGSASQQTVLQDVALYGLGRLGLFERNLSMTNGQPAAQPTMRAVGYRQYELADHLGAIRAVISDRKVGDDADGDGQVNVYHSDEVFAADYYPFGWPLPDRFNDAHSYRYAFGGAPRDDEIAGPGKVYDFGARIYNASVGRFMSTDPMRMAYSYYSPYLFAGDKPVSAIDALGMQECRDPVCVEGGESANDLPAQGPPPSSGGSASQGGPAKPPQVQDPDLVPIPRATETRRAKPQTVEDPALVPIPKNAPVMPEPAPRCCGLPPFDPTYEPPYEPPKISAIDPPLFRRRTPLSVEEKMEMSNNALIELAQSERLKRLEARYRELEELEHTLKPQGRELLEEVNHVGYDWIEKRREIEERNELFELRLRVMRSQDLRNELELQREMMFRDMRMPYPVPD